MIGGSEFQGLQLKPFDDETRVVEEYLVVLFSRSGQVSEA